MHLALGTAILGLGAYLFVAGAELNSGYRDTLLSFSSIVSGFGLSLILYSGLILSTVFRAVQTGASAS